MGGLGAQSPLYASPEMLGGSNIKGRGAKASALKTSLEIASTSVRGCGAPRVGRSWRPRLGRHRRHSLQSNSLSRGGRRPLQEGEAQGKPWRVGGSIPPGAPRNPAAHSQYKALQQDGRRSAPCCPTPERPNEDGQGRLGGGGEGGSA